MRPLLVLPLLALPATAAIDFNRDIQPILSENCYHCHGPDAKAREADLRLDKKEGAYRTLDGVTSIKPGDSAGSEVIVRILSDDKDDVMPPPKSNRKLTAEQKQLLKRWVDAGAPWGEHWAFIAPVRPEVPRIADWKNGAGGFGDWSANPIDAFILKKLVEEKLAPSREAAPEDLVRRMTLDLTGLPPTLAEVEAFVREFQSTVTNHQSPDPAVARLADRLLASPRYGERLAWDWLDAARYADTNGFQGDPERTMWPWRDWVVNAFNANMPYDRFTIEQLAGDLLPAATREQKLASGFNRNNMHNGEGGRIPEETRVENVFDRVETTATIWLGATFNCCRCHDHKFDPYPQRDYFALYDVFNQMSETGQGRGGQAAPVLDFSTPEEEQRAKAAVQKVNQAAVEVDAFERGKFPRPEGVPLAESDAAKLPGNLPATLAKVLPQKRNVDGLLEAIGYFEGDGKDPAYVKVLKKLLAAVRARDAAQSAITKVMIMDHLEKPRDTFILMKGAYDKATEHRVFGAAPAVLRPANLPAPEKPWTRLDLARWLVAPENPLTARVTVNRYWQMLFGTGLVKTVDDFGVQGEKPSHPELLDWLATEFVRTGWDVKALLRLMVTSAAYRQSSHVVPPSGGRNLSTTADAPDVSAALLPPEGGTTYERDPDNRLLARGPRHRLPSWMLRDQALAVSGLLVDRLGGPAVKPYQPEGIWEEATFGKKTYKQDHGEALYRRSLYIFWRRIVAPTLFFDTANRQNCTVKVPRTNTPLHALVTLNDITYVEAARALAERILKQGGATDSERLAHGFRLCTGRGPGEKEAAILASSLARFRQQYTADPAAAARLIATGESKPDASLPTPELAAHTSLALLLLNLDETLSKE
jgi:hypothetical protein